MKLHSRHIDDITFVRCHRIGKQFNISRSIIVRFCDFSHRQMVWEARTKSNNNTLTISENFCGGTEFNRHQLYPIYRTAKRMDPYKNKVSLVEDTLIVNSKSYDVDTIDDPPDDIHPKNMSEKSNAQCLVFGGMYSEYSKHSNWSHSKFTFKGRPFLCLEQGYMYHKAMLNDDLESVRKISFTTNPREIKPLGSAVNVRNTDNWNAVKGNLMLELVWAKYDQNDDLKQLLLDTGSQRLGEIWKDSFFSIGLPLTHPDVLVTKKWKSNHLRNALEIARRDFRDH